MKYAWLSNTTIRDICPGNPAESYHPDIAALYDTQVPDDAAPGDTFADGVLTKPVVPEYIAPEPVAPVAPKPPTVKVIDYKMLFTSAERIASKASTDPVMVDLMEIMNDPRTTHIDLARQSMSDALDYMTHIGILAVGRKAEILTGVVR